MQDSSDHFNALTFATKDVPVGELNKAWRDTIAGLDSYFQQTRQSYDTRRNHWEGKIYKGRHRGKKVGPNAFPWPGASDMDTNITQERCLKYVAQFLRALDRSHIQAYPVEESDVARSRIVSRFLKWMRTNWIPNFRKQAEQCANYGLEKAIFITYTGWEKKSVSLMKSLKARDLPEDMQDALQDPENEPLLAQMLKGDGGLADLSDSRARRAISALRNKGEAKVAYTAEEINRPTVTACSPDGEVFYPAWCRDPEKSPYVFYREMMTAQQILNRVESDGWDKAWANDVIRNQRGKSSLTRDPNIEGQWTTLDVENQSSELIEVVWVYQRLIDEDEGAEGIYCTVICPGVDMVEDGKPYAYRELLEGNNYPIVTTPLFDDQSNLYDTQTISDLTQSAQDSVKAERDARVDANGLRNNPPMMHPAGRPPSGRWMPGGRVGYRKGGEFHFADAPPANPQSMADEQIMLTQIDRLLGLDPEDPNGAALRDFFVQKFLEHQAKVLSMCYENYQRYGPEEVFFHVTGFPDMNRMEKRPGEKLDIAISFDSLFDDPDNMEKMLRTIGDLLPYDDSGMIDKQEWIATAMGAISPAFSMRLLKPADESQRDFERKVVDDLARIDSGFEVNAQPNGAPMALDIVKRWASQPDIQAKLEANPLMVQRLQTYVMQYVFDMQQQENAQTGKLGTPPAQFDTTDPAMNGAASQAASVRR